MNTLTRLLGNLELWHDGQSVPSDAWPSRKVRQLLGILVTHGYRSIGVGVALALSAVLAACRPINPAALLTPVGGRGDIVLASNRVLPASPKQGSANDIECSQAAIGHEELGGRGLWSYVRVVPTKTKARP